MIISPFNTIELKCLNKEDLILIQRQTRAHVREVAPLLWEMQKEVKMHKVFHREEQVPIQRPLLTRCCNKLKLYKESAITMHRRPSLKNKRTQVLRRSFILLGSLLEMHSVPLAQRRTWCLEINMNMKESWEYSQKRISPEFVNNLLINFKTVTVMFQT